MKKPQALIVFAAFAVMGLLAGPGRNQYQGDEDDETLAEDAWNIARAMIEAAPEEVFER